MYCVNCGQAVEGAIPICSHCARLVIAKDEERERFLEFIRQEAQATISSEEEPTAAAPEVEPPAPQSEERIPDDLQPTEETPADQVAESKSETDELGGSMPIICFILFILFFLAVYMIAVSA